MRLMIFSDASHCLHTGAAGWGVWFRQGGWHQGRFASGAFREPLLHSHEAEFLAIVNALSIATKEGYLAGVDSLYLQADNVHALGRLLVLLDATALHDTERGPRDVPVVPMRQPFRPPKRMAADDPRRVRFIERRDRAEAMVAELAPSLPARRYIKHVRGHQRQVDGAGRGWINAECDRLAKVAMRRMQGQWKKDLTKKTQAAILKE